MNRQIKLIAETAWHHEGDFDFLFALINTIIYQSKANFIKLHITLSLNEYMCKDHPSYNVLSKMMLKKAQWEKIINLIKESDKELMLLLNDIDAVEFGMSFSPKLVEIHSVCLNDIHLLNKLRHFINNETFVVLGVGGSTLYEIENSINQLNTSNIILMHGFQNYPTKYQDINFKKIRKIMALYPQFKHGYADHTTWDEPNNDFITCMGAALGIEYIEKHVTTIPGKERLDWHAAVSIDYLNKIADYLEVLNKCEGSGLLEMNKGEEVYSTYGFMKKAAFINKALKKGHALTIDDVCFKRTGQKSEMSQLEIAKLFGKVAISDLESSIIIHKDMFE